jgi:cytoskeletal protein CcmA (bactofilin family)
MFKKKELVQENTSDNIYEPKPDKFNNKQNVNNILKGSKLTGDINVSYDLELSGEVEGNIRAEKNSNIVIRGICKGNIKTEEGSVNIEGELNGGDIISGKDVRVTGKFLGGKIEAKGNIYVNGEFEGRLDGNEVEIGSQATGKGEIFYKEYVSILKGAKIETQVNMVQKEIKAEKKPAEGKPEDKKVVIELTNQKKGEMTVH